MGAADIKPRCPHLPLPSFTGEEEPEPKAWEVRVLLAPVYRPSPPTRFASGPLLSRGKRERGFAWAAAR
jgi:hypothetical protein